MSPYVETRLASSRMLKTCVARRSSPKPLKVCVRENSFLGNPVEGNARKSSPGGANELSPALQRWEKRAQRFKSRRDD